jgi:hypothetical protein
MTRDLIIRQIQKKNIIKIQEMPGLINRSTTSPS